MRNETWDVDLLNFIKSRKNTKFEWGVHDCTLFAADCIKIMTGIDPSEGYRNYSTKEGAALIVGKVGSLREFITSILGQEIPTNLAMRGDCVMLKNQDNEETIGIHLGSSVVVAGKEHLELISPVNLIAAWGVR